MFFFFFKTALCPHEEQTNSGVRRVPVFLLCPFFGSDLLKSPECSPSSLIALKQSKISGR